MKLNKFAYLYSKPLGHHALEIMKKIPGNLLKKPGKIMEFCQYEKSTRPQHLSYLYICEQLIVYLHQQISIVKFEIFNDLKIMPSKVRLRNHPLEFGHVCVDEWFPKSTCPHSF